MSYQFESKRDELYFKNYNALREAIEYASGNGDKVLKTVEDFLDTLARNNISVSAKYLRAGQSSSENKEIQNETVRNYIKNGSKGDLNLYNTPITSLPEGLRVGGYLNLSYTKITSLPEGLSVDGDLNLSYTPISKKYTAAQLKQMLPNVKGEIYC